MADDTTTHEDDTTTTTAKRRPWQRGATTSSNGAGGSSGSTPDIARLRTLLAQLLWAICVLFAAILAVAVLLIAVDANPDNDLVLWVIHRADNVDLGFFDLNNPVKDWDVSETNPAQDVKTALFNYGIAALIWLGIGKFLEKVVRA